MKKAERIRKLLIILFGGMAVAGAILIMTRENPWEELIGDVIVSNSADYIALDQHRYSYNDEDTEKKTNNFVPIEEASDIPVMRYYPDDERCNISVSYSEDYFGALDYTVYDSDFNVMIEHQPKLTLPAERGKKYYVCIIVNWGSKKRYVKTMYYFALDVIDNSE